MKISLTKSFKEKLFFILRFSLFVYCLCTLFPVTLYAQETFQTNGAPDNRHNYYAFTNAKIFVDYQTVIEKATLLIKDGVVEGAGDKVPIPKGAVIYDLKGKSIYPSLIDIYTTYGMPEIKKPERAIARVPQRESTVKGAYGWNQAIKPETEAEKLFSSDAKAAEDLRKLGFGAVLTFRRDGIARGSAVFVSLADKNENETILKDKAAAMYSFDKGTSTQDYPSSLMGSIALLRQTYYDSQWYAKSSPLSFGEGQGVRRGEVNISLDAWNKLQSLPQIFEVKDKLSSLRADKLGDEFKTQYIIKGDGDEYQRMDDIKATNARFILPLNFPATFDVEDPYNAAMVSLAEMKNWEMAPMNPSAFEKEHIPFAITADGLKDKKEFWKNMRKAIEYGLSETQALKSLTFTPAEMLGMKDKIGSLKKGMLASFIITSGNLFDEKNILYSNWVQGDEYVLKDMNVMDIRGNYNLSIGANTYNLKISGEAEKFKAEVSVNDTVKAAETNLSLSGKLISINYIFRKDEGPARLSGTISENPLAMKGKGQMPNGDWIDWNAIFKSELSQKDTAKKDTSNKSPGKEMKHYPTLDDVIYPFTAYGQKKQDSTLLEKFRNRWDAVIIRNATVWTNEAEGILQNKDVMIADGKIVRIGENLEVPNTVQVQLIDGTGKHVTAGIIDEHSHIAISQGVNEGTQASSAEVRISDVIDCEDINIYRNLSGGVVASQLLHGSANPIGGQSAIVKLRWGKSPEEMKIKNADGFIKFALGENVKQSNWGDLNTLRFPQTRMGVEQVYYDYFTRAKEYASKWKEYQANENVFEWGKSGPSLRKDLELDALAEILDKKRFITCHSYVQSEINMLMHVGDSMGFRVNTFTHILEGYKVADKMKAHGVGASSFSDWWSYKMEVKEAIPYNGAILHKMGVVTAFNSDDAEMARRLNQEAAKAVKYGGLSEEEALKFVTLNPAKLLHLDSRMGSIKVGKDADVVLWTDNPLSVYAKVDKTIIDGQIYFDADTDQKLRDEIRKERSRIINLMIQAKKGGEPTQKPEKKEKKEYNCHGEWEE